MEAGRDDISSFLEADLLQQALREVANPIGLPVDGLKTQPRVLVREPSPMASTSYAIPSGVVGGVNQPVILVPTHNPDGTVTYSLHPQVIAPVKLSSPMKSFQMITQQLPTTVKPVKVGSSAGKTRMHPILLPKQTPPPVATGPVMPALSLPPPSVTVTGAIGEKSLPVKSTEILRVPQGCLPLGVRAEDNGISCGRPVRAPVTSLQFRVPPVNAAVQSERGDLSTSTTPTFKNTFSPLINHATLYNPQVTTTQIQAKMQQPTDSPNHISNHLHKNLLDTKPPENSFSVAAFVQEMTARSRGRGKAKNRGRPRKGQTKRVNDKKLVSDLRKELGIPEVRAKALGLVDDECIDVDETENDLETAEEAVNLLPGRSTRSGRRPRLKNRDMDGTTSIDDADGKEADTAGEPGAEAREKASTANRRTFVPPARFICKVCGKIYLGHKKMTRHLKYFPDHSFVTPNPPLSPGGGASKKPFNPEAWVTETEPSAVLDQVGPKLFQSFTLWELLVKKVSLKQLGTAEVLSSMFADIQALVMDLKNMVDQCLTNLRTNEDSFSVILTPMISSILGQSQNGGVERFVLPYNQIPVHYHMLLGFPMGLKNSRPTDVFSPDSTNSIFQPDEDNSQMSLASDTPDRPLVDRVVLEANLGTQETDEETQDSSRMSSKRQRLDSESQSVTSPPPPTPDFLRPEEEESNLSTTSNLTNKDIGAEQSNSIDNIPVKELIASEDKTAIDSIRKNLIELTARSSSSVSASVTTGSITESTRTKLPSFSSIICGSPNPHSSAEEKIESNGGQPCGTILAANSTGDSDIKDCRSFQFKEDTIAGAAGPVDPEIEYIRNLEPMAPTSVEDFQGRRGSVELVLTTASTAKLSSSSGRETASAFSSGKGIDMIDSGQMLAEAADVIQGDLPDNRVVLPPQQPESLTTAAAAADTCRPFNYVESDEVLQEMMKVSIPAPVTSPFQISSDNAVFNVSTPTIFNSTNKHGFLETPPKDPHAMAGTKTFSTPPDGESFLGRDLKPSLAPDKIPDTDDRKPFPGIDLLIAKSETFFTSPSQASSTAPPSSGGVRGTRSSDFETSTQVTFSDLNHPIPSVSPVKETVKSPGSSLPPPASQSPNLFNDLESVLNESEAFAFHSALSANVGNTAAKTPEKLLASVPPAIISKKSTIIYDAYVDPDVGAPPSSNAANLIGTSSSSQASSSTPPMIDEQ